MGGLVPGVVGVVGVLGKRPPKLGGLETGGPKRTKGELELSLVGVRLRAIAAAREEEKPLLALVFPVR